ncbi:MAG: hypothetical protein L0H71_09355, partial [Yaniella sp.]|nr:hypothetical protein [Yaniella sp.]
HEADYRVPQSNHNDDDGSRELRLNTSTESPELPGDILGTLNNLTGRTDCSTAARVRGDRCTRTWEGS